MYLFYMYFRLPIFKKIFFLFFFFPNQKPSLYMRVYILEDMYLDQTD